MLESIKKAENMLELHRLAREAKASEKYDISEINNAVTKRKKELVKMGSKVKSKIERIKPTVPYTGVTPFMPFPIKVENPNGLSVTVISSNSTVII